MIGLPMFVAELLAGVFLGYGVAVKFIQKYAITVFRLNNQDIIGTISLFAYTMFIFLSGVKMDLSIVFRTGSKAFHTGSLAMVAPLLLGAGAQLLLSRHFQLNKQENLQLMFVLTTHSLTSFPVVACLLEDLKIFNSELGRLGLSSSIISDILGVVLTTLATLAKVWDKSIGLAILDLFLVVAFVLVVIYVARPTMMWMVSQTPEGRPVKKVYISVIVLAVLGSAMLSDWYHMTLVFGPMILGLAVPDGPPLGSALVKKFDPMVSGVFMPIFVTISMIKANPEDLNLSTKVAKANGLLVLVTVLAKFVFSLLPPMLSRMPFKDALAIAFIMSYKGVVEMASYGIARDSKVIDLEVYCFVMATIFVTAIIVPFAVRYLYDPMRKYAGYQKRNIMQSAANDAELRIVTCINRPDNTAAMINLLDVSCPNKEGPIAVYVLHLIELVGRATPVFISHQLQKKTLSNYSYSENVILSFSHFQRENHGSAYVNVFTAISPTEYMHEDICTLALDKLASLIVVPFHKKWSLDGITIESEDLTLRSINCSVMERAPCSVAILVDRGQSESVESMASRQASYRVAMIFLGGSDDREALTFAKRMAKDSCITLTLVHFVSTVADQDREIKQWEKVLDNEVLKEIIQNHNQDQDGANAGHHGSVGYVREMVKDGTETATSLRSMVDDYELFIVGRRYKQQSNLTSGLDEWSELRELGVVGDLLASTDFTTKASVLIVQQQKTS
ncbi:DNA-directed DNA polymerase [Parasponia andersonii]|uniref:DNA-directed DNA polymerase n=1 Tax=Parasponia andersonii TaxID=3476 RepID=A0A2P5AZA6_PARAD|nr:DNA-directed DNA polymerase [Parasponia andersonii]